MVPTCGNEGQVLFLLKLVPSSLRDGHFCSPSLPWLDTWLVLPLAIVICVALNPGVQTQALSLSFLWPPRGQTHKQNSRYCTPSPKPLCQTLVMRSESPRG